MTKLPKQRGKIIAERKVSRRAADGEADTICVGLEEPVETPADIEPPSDKSVMLWRCVAYIEEMGKVTRVPVTSVDSMGALTEGLWIALKLLEGVYTRYGDEVTFLGQSDLLLGVPKYPALR